MRIVAERKDSSCEEARMKLRGGQLSALSKMIRLFSDIRIVLPSSLMPVCTYEDP